MTITISPQLENRLKETAAQEGREPNALAEDLIAAGLDWAARERAEAIAGVQRGLDASAARRVRPADDVLNDLRALLPPRTSSTSPTCP